jgi:putative transposase
MRSKRESLSGREHRVRSDDTADDEQSDDKIVFPSERWTATFQSHAQLIIHEVDEYLGSSSPPLLERLIEDAKKINQQRPILQETLATATQPRCEP